MKNKRILQYKKQQDSENFAVRGSVIQYGHGREEWEPVILFFAAVLAGLL